MGERQTIGLQPLSKALWAERHELESLLARVVALRLVLQAGEHRFVSACLNEVEVSATALAALTGVRDEALAAVPSAPTCLAALSLNAPTPLGWTFSEHEASLRGLLDDLDREVETTRRLARNAREQTLDSLSILHAGRASAADELSELAVMELELRAQACRGVLVALRELAPASLRAFVGPGGPARSD